MNLERKDPNIALSINTYTYINSNPIKLSIIIVTFNRADLLDLLLRSLQKQLFNDFEIIVVDNDSEDNTSEISREFNLIYVKLNKNYGLSIGRNVGLKYARGDIVCFLDDDAIVDKTFVKSHYEAHMNYNIFCLRGKALPKTKSIFNCIPGHYDLGNEIVPAPINLEGNSSFNKHILDEIGGFDPDLYIHFHEGIELTYRIFQKYNCELNKSIYYPNSIIYHDYAKNYFNLLKKTYLNELRNRKLRAEAPELIKFINRFPESKNKFVDKRCKFFKIFYGLNVKFIILYINFKFNKLRFFK